MKDLIPNAMRAICIEKVHTPMVFVSLADFPYIFSEFSSALTHHISNINKINTAHQIAGSGLPQYLKSPARPSINARQPLPICLLN